MIPDLKMPRRLFLGLMLAVGLAGCSLAAPGSAGDDRLQVVATTSIVADVVKEVGGDAIEVTTLLPLGADPHAYTPTPQDLRTLNQADVIFINGLGLEESLMPVLETLDSGAPVVSVNADVDPLPAAEGHAGHPGEGDPHTWFDVANVILWTGTIRDALSELDPAHASAYADAAEAYSTALLNLDLELREQIETLPPDRRKLVTDHAEFNYFARAYGFEVIGTVIPAVSTMAQPSAQELAALQDQIRGEGVPAIFVGTAVNPSVAQQIARDVGIEVVTLYTGSLSEADGPAASYPDLMRYTVDRIVTALAAE